ncbi:MAG TPA: ABC transporter permease [Gemmatimonadaceae bacterium]|nr:ABC transporter permease [Gemmatimonadaceae bacterium]
MDALMQDVRFAIRSLAKAPIFTALSVLCLSIGIGLNANIYGAVYMVFQRPFPFADPDRLVVVEQRNAKRGWTGQSTSFENFRDIQRQAPVFDQTAGISFRSITITDKNDPVRLEGEAVSWNLFQLLGVQPYLGRTFRPDEDVAGAPRTIVLGYGVWEERYGADSSIIGRTLPVNGLPHTVVGVMPRNFKFPDNIDAWIAITPLLDGHGRDVMEVDVYGRLKPNADVRGASTELGSISKRLAELYPKAIGDWTMFAMPLREEFIDGDTKLVIVAMMGAVTFVLLIACANVANLLLARATSRGREIAVRAALGAGKARIVRQLLTESILLALIACPIGIGIAYWLLDVILASIPDGDMPYYMVFEINGPVLLYTVLIAALTGVIFGLAPALQAARGDLQSTLKDGGRGSGTGVGRGRLRTVLAVGEVALSMVLLVGGALFVRSFLNLQTRTGGIDIENLLTMRVYMPGERYDSATAISNRIEDVVRRIQSIPGVVSATASNQIALSGGGSRGAVEIEGKPVANVADAPSVRWTGVTDDWLGTLRVPLVAGRDLTEQESRARTDVAVINQSMAKKFWPDASPLGRRFRVLGDTTDRWLNEDRWLTVVGVSRDYVPFGLDSPDPIGPNFVVAYNYLSTRNTGLTIRTEGDAAQITAAVRKAIRESDPSLPVFEVMSMKEVRHQGIWSQRLFGWMFSMFGLVALVLASVGVYGVISYGVSQRTQEIGVRVALGAQPADVIRLVVGHGARLALIGIGIGLAGALGLTRVVQSLLFDVSSTDALSFAGVTVFLGAVALFASYVPARRATRVDPLTALRAE